MGIGQEQDCPESVQARMDGTMWLEQKGYKCNYFLIFKKIIFLE